jgi:DNA-binding NtrC family response regulator
MAHDWPGNVRELRNVLDRAIYIARSSDQQNLRLVDLPIAATPRPSDATSGWVFDENATYRECRTQFEHEFERRYVSWLLERHSHNVSAAARAAKMDRKYLHDLARKHGLRERDP